MDSRAPWVIFNPNARGGRTAGLLRFLRRPGISCVLKPTAGPGDARHLATAASHAGCATVVVAGGDGTLNEVLTGLSQVPGTFNRLRVGLLPMGTANVFAREHGLPRDLPSAWAILLQGCERKIDLVRLDYQKGGDRCQGVFAQMAGAGLDARAIEKVTWPLKRRWGPLAYVWTAWGTVREPQPEIQAVFDGGRASGQLVLAGNGQYYGGPFRMFTKANPTDGVLDCLVFPKVNWGVVGRTLCALGRGCSPAPSCAIHVQTRRLYLSSSSPIPLELDGEAVGHLPVQMAVEPSVMRLLVPGCPA